MVLTPSQIIALRGLLRRYPGFFDAGYYKRQFGRKNLFAWLFPQTHFLIVGARAGRAPNGVFDAAYYRQTAGLSPNENPVLHYLQHGWRQSFNPHPLFSSAYYTQKHPAIEGEPLSHYLTKGWRQNYNPHPLFDGAHYLHAYQDIAATGINPLQHYIASGAREARKPNALFKPDHYILGVSGGLAVDQALLHFDRTAAPEVKALYSAAEKLLYKGPVGRIDDYARATGRRVINIAAENSHIWQSPSVINRPEPRHEIHATLPKRYVAILRDVTAFPGSRLLLTQDGQMLHDELASPDANDYQDKLKAIGNYKDGICTISAVKVPEKLDRALLISSDSDFNYFHMLIETLPKLILAEQAGCPKDIPLLMQSDLHPNLIEALRIMAGTRPIIYWPWGSAIEVGELWCPSDLSRVLNPDGASNEAYDIVTAPDVVREIRQRLLQDRSVPRGNKKIYLSRNSNVRLLKNQDEFMTMLTSKGFQIIDTGRMTLTEQMDAVSGVELIIAPTGASLTNLLWCPDNAKALILVSDHQKMNLNIFNQVGEPVGVEVEFCLGNRVHKMAGQYDVHDDFEVDLDLVSQWCDNHSKDKAA